MKPMRHIATPRAAAQPRKSSIYFVPLTFFARPSCRPRALTRRSLRPSYCPQSIRPAKNRSAALDSLAFFALKPAVYTFSTCFFEFANKNVVFGSEFRPFTRLLSYTQKMCGWWAGWFPTTACITASSRKFSDEAEAMNRMGRLVLFPFSFLIFNFLKTYSRG